MAIDTIFIRHNLDSEKYILEDLWDNDLIAIHYIDDPSLDPDHYRKLSEKSAASALDRLISCLNTGANVAASYRAIKPAMMKIGRIDPQKSILRSKIYKDANGNDLIYKVINLVDVQNIDLISYPVLAGIQPMRATITGWPSAARILNSILSYKSLPLELASLHPSQLEVLCYEYLQQKGILTHLLVPIGRSMYDIDICGLTYSGDVIVAQVTHSDSQKDVDEKANRLSAFSAKASQLIFFGLEAVKPTDKGLVFIAIEDVFDYMLKRCRTLVSKMIH
jgi:hypothetical protein